MILYSNKLYYLDFNKEFNFIIIFIDNGSRL